MRQRNSLRCKLLILVLALVLIVPILLACGGKEEKATVTASPTPTATAQGPIIGGPCKYTDIPGVATVVSVKDAETQTSDCQNAVEVVFDFTPDNPAAVDSYRFPNWSDKGQHFTVGGGLNPPRPWVIEQGLTEGSQHRCVRSEITSGTCTPVNFSFPDIDQSGWSAACTEQGAIDGGPCKYTDIPGVATVVSVKDAETQTSECQNAVEVVFDFTPDNPAAVDSYRFPNWSDKGQHFTVGGGLNPPRPWVVEQGLTEGSQHRCVRSEITSGTCTPVNFSFPDIDQSGWSAACVSK